MRRPLKTIVSGQHVGKDLNPGGKRRRAPCSSGDPWDVWEFRMLAALLNILLEVSAAQLQYRLPKE